jgi:hypothetical protein
VSLGGSLARVRSRTVLDDILLWFITIALLIWSFREWVDIWVHRPLVMWDEVYKCWRAAPRLHCQD